MSKTNLALAPFREVQADRLETINEQLARLRLPLLKRLGKYQNGEIEIISLENDLPTDLYIVGQYEVLFPPNGKRGFFYPQYQIDSDQHPACVIIPVINGTHFVLLRSHRPAAMTMEHSWFTEFPRGFPSNNLQPTMLDRKLRSAIPEGQPPPASALQIIGRKLVALLTRDDVHIEKFDRLDGEGDEEGLFQDPGRSGDTLTFWEIRLRVPDLEQLIREVKGPQHMRVRFIPCRELLTIQSQRKHDIRDLIDRSAISLWQEKNT